MCKREEDWAKFDTAEAAKKCIHFLLRIGNDGKWYRYRELHVSIYTVERLLIED